MENDQPSARLPEHFYASSKSHLNRTRFWLWGGAAIGIAISAATAKGGLSWFVVLFMLGFIGLMDWVLRSQMHKGKALVSIDHLGISSPAFAGKSKRYSWEYIAEITFTRVQNAPMLQLVLKASSGYPDKRSFWNGRNAARPSIALSALDEPSQIALRQAIENHGKSNVLGIASPKIDDQLQQEKVFQNQLKSLTPIPWLTYGLIATNAAVWLVSLLFGAGFSGTPAELLLRWGGNAASEVQRGEWWRLISALFLHSSLMHVVLNMLGLYSAGIMVERIYGHRLFALVYLGSGLVGSALSLHFAAQSAVSVGASGAVFGVTGALLVSLLQHRKHLPKTLGKQTLGSLGFFILYSLIQGFGKQGIDNAAHVGGLLAGCLLTLILPARFDLEAFVRSQKNRALLGILIAAGATASLAAMAPIARVDQRGQVFFFNGMRDLSEALQAMQKEQQDVASGKISEKESDDRSRTVFAPMTRKAMLDLDKAQLAAADPRQPMLEDAKRMSALLTESLEMASVFPEGAAKPQPADPQRSAAIEKELQDVAKHLAGLQASLQNGANR